MEKYIVDVWFKVKTVRLSAKSEADARKKVKAKCKESVSEMNIVKIGL